MKKYLIRIESERPDGVRISEAVCINGDSLRPFQIAGNLWNYVTPWTAAQRLEKLAQSWESHGHTVRRIYGNVSDMPTKGNESNVGMILREWRAGA